MSLKDDVRVDFLKEENKTREFDKIRVLSDISEENEYSIDDQTWNDLNMNDIYEEIDKTYSTPGEQVLYSIFKNPLMSEEKLNKRSELIDYFIENQDLTTEIRFNLFKLGHDKKNRLLEMISDKLPVNKQKYWLYKVLGNFIPIALIVLAFIFQEPRLNLLLLVSVLVNIEINRKEREIIKSHGLSYLSDLFITSEKICKIKDPKISHYVENLNYNLENITSLKNGTIVIKIINAFGGLLELLSIPFLLEETTFYKISDKIEENAGEIYRIYYLIGELDALTAIASYKACNKSKLSKPRFINENQLKVVDGVHPVLKKPVPNSISIDGKGIVLTGTNMSGKSTFLRMLGANIVLAQTMNFVMAKEYEGCFLNIVSSIAPKDDINAGKSYYLAEAESILRIIKALEKDVTVFCPIDEIFRGTNPVERISSSAEILSYINERNAIAIVATHDRELTDMLKDEYEFYYFSEDIDDNTGLSFDYKLKKGVSKTRNAIRLLEYIGYPNEIIQKSYKRSEELEKYI
ncbi:MAG: DNA mismatch repair protein MutS [Clostridium sp.]|uniref:MutS-related protein n=1 Tax=Clostridium sp. TaxID=1506 RepID=UPI002906C110|nr:DNA mismatch repair protein MutS [Clostridium sp.]MDU4939089.1 DNA mismatch repair protein MutS [Clostridium sp.]